MIVDLHTHVLPALDDGPATMDESIAAIAAAAEQGVGTLAATPHVRHDYPTTPSAMEELVAELAERVAHAGLPTRILPGGELAVEEAAALPDDQLGRFGLGGSRSAILVEFPLETWPAGLAHELAALRARGFRPVLAHPERNPDVQAAPGRLSSLVDEGAVVQLTATSLAGRSGARALRTAQRLLELRLAHLLSSDMHGSFRSGSFEDAFSRLRDEPLARWLTTQVPTALVSDADLPPRPERRRRRLPRFR